MHNRQTQVLRALTRVQGFLDTHDAELGGVNSTGARSKLDAIVAELAALADQQDPMGFERQRTSERQATSRQAVVKEWLRPIVKIGRALRREDLAFPVTRLPDHKVDVTTFVIQARSVLGVAAAHVDAYVTAGLQPEFVARVGEAIDSLAQAVAERQTAITARVNATEKLESEIRKGTAIVQAIDAMIDRFLTDGLRAGWVSTRRIVSRAAASTTPEPGDAAGTPGATDPPAAPSPVTVDDPSPGGAP